jgi:hypothetical protein
VTTGACLACAGPGEEEADLVRRVQDTVRGQIPQAMLSSTVDLNVPLSCTHISPFPYRFSNFFPTNCSCH